MSGSAIASRLRRTCGSIEPRRKTICMRHAPIGRLVHLRPWACMGNADAGVAQLAERQPSKPLGLCAVLSRVGP
jgi:hypothetical protein